MPLNDNEKLLVEAVKNMLGYDDELGLAIHRDDNQDTHELGSTYLHNNINDMFTLKAADLTHSESIIRAFHKVHSFKCITDMTFPLAMDKEMTAEGVPTMERVTAVSLIPAIVAELIDEDKAFCEADAGFNPDLDEVRRVSKPEQPIDFSIIDSPLNKRNIDKPESGDASMGHAP